MSPEQHAKLIVDIAEEIVMERAIQIQEKGYTTKHDDEHDGGELCGAAACYAVNAACLLSPYTMQGLEEKDMSGLPWPDGWRWKPKDARRSLVIAAALILAEIEKFDRCLPAAQS